jgi:hypothetical protein
MMKTCIQGGFTVAARHLPQLQANIGRAGFRPKIVDGRQGGSSFQGTVDLIGPEPSIILIQTGNHGYLYVQVGIYPESGMEDGTIRRAEEHIPVLIERLRPGPPLEEAIAIEASLAATMQRLIPNA